MGQRMTSEAIEELIRKAGLTPREFEVLELLRTTKSQKEISVTLNLSWNTIKFHAANIYRKFHVWNRIELIELIGFKP